jgi:hypothetical protein
MSNTQIPVINFTREDIKNLTINVHFLFEQTSQIFNKYNNNPASNSIAFQEIAVFQNPELVNTAYSLGNLSMESAADHLIAFADLLVEPVKTIAPWTCVRRLLESCALACWFLNPDINALNRVRRSFAFRYKGFEEQLKLFRKSKNQAEIDRLEKRIQKVEKDALALGFNKLLNKKGKINGIGQLMPSITELIEATLNREVDYRLLSAVAHGHPWAIQQISFEVLELKKSQRNLTKGLKKTALPNFIIYIGMIAVMSFSKVLWYMWQLYGWDLNELENLLDTTYDKLNYNSKVRFWRIPVGSTLD